MHRLVSALLAAVLLGSVAVATAAPAAGAACPVVDPTTHVVAPAPTYGIDWSGCDLSGAELGLYSISGADLSGADLSGADLSVAVLTGTTLAGANLAGAALSSAVLTRVDLSGADLTGASLYAARGAGLVGVPVGLAASWSIERGYLVGPNADLAGARLDDADLSGRDLSEAVLVGASLARADLAGANLHHALMVGANLLDADVDSATDLGTALLDGVRSGSLDGTTALLPPGWSVSKGHLVGPRADLAYADLSGASLAGRSLQESYLTGADLSGADLAGADLQNVEATFASFDGSDLESALMSGSSFDAARFDGADLDGATLTGSSLRSANLSSASLRSAALAFSDLTLAGMSGADLTGATGLELATADDVYWAASRCPDGELGSAHIGSSCQQPLDTTAPAVALAPIPTYTLPSSQGQLVVRATVSDSGSGVASARVRWRSQALGSTTWSAYRYGPTSGADWTQYVDIKPGRRYCVQVSGTDYAGNTATWTAPVCTVVPFDDQSLVAAGAWSRDPSAGSGWFRGSRSSSSSAGASLTTSASYPVAQVGVVARTCATCGRVAVYVGATKVGTVSLVSATTTYRKHLLLTLPKAVSGKVRLVVATTGRPVAIDGLSIRTP